MVFITLFSFSLIHESKISTVEDRQGKKNLITLSIKDLSRLWPVLSLNMDTGSWRVSRWYGSFLLEWGWLCLKRFCCLAFIIVLTSEYVVDLSFEHMLCLSLQEYLRSHCHGCRSETGSIEGLLYASYRGV